MSHIRDSLGVVHFGGPELPWNGSRSGDAHEARLEFSAKLIFHSALCHFPVREGS